MFDYQKYNKINKNIKELQKKTQVIAISKNNPLSSIEVAVYHGVEDFGENRVQEAKLKFENIFKKKNNIKLHLTGPLQTNKVKQALSLFDIFHTLDREKLLNELVKHKDIINTKSFFIQVNTGNESSKSGIRPDEARIFLDLCKSKGVNNILGLMCIPPVYEDPRIHFDLINNMSKDLGLGRPSIGMSSDYTIALDYDPQYIRLGTVLFGKRI